jgi:hypothetical protein
MLPGAEEWGGSKELVEVVNNQSIYSTALSYLISSTCSSYEEPHYFYF